VYSVISPESCAAIIYRDSGKAEQAAAALRLTAEDLQSLGLVDGIVPEPPGGAQEDWNVAAENLRVALRARLDELSGLPAADLVERRYLKFRNMGNFFA
jgi:acetyl-CoA carboxylase carboxyl transferase subunit alpha